MLIYKLKYANSVKLIENKMEFLKTIFSYTLSSKKAYKLPWVNKIEAMDDIVAIEYSTQQLNIDFKKNLFNNKHQVKALLEADEKLHSIVERVTALYVNKDHINIELDERYSQAVFLYHRQLFLIYFNLIENIAEMHPSILLKLILHAIDSAAQMIKWRFYLYQSAPANVWLQLSQLYRVAEQKLLLNIENQLYIGEPATTISATYIQVCMLGSLESLSFKRQQIDLVINILKKLVTKTDIEAIYDEKNHLFYVDTLANKPAQRTNNLKSADSCRYWNFDTFNSTVELYVSAAEFNILPKQLLLKEFISNVHFLPTLKVLRTEWSRNDYKLQRRCEDRVKTIKFATAAYGYKAICEQLKQFENIQSQLGRKTYQSGKSFEERLASHQVIKSTAESNIIYVDLSPGYTNIVNESKKGLGLNVNASDNNVSLGRLIGVSEKELKFGTRMGVIRSIRTIAGNEMHIGVEVITSTAINVVAKNMSTAAEKLRVSATTFMNTQIASTNDSETFTCMFLPEEYGIAMQHTFILPIYQYNKKDLFKVKIEGKNIAIKFTDVIEKNEDWIRVAYIDITPTPH